MRRRRTVFLLAGALTGGVARRALGRTGDAVVPAFPGRRAGHALAYHAGARAVVLVGGDYEGMTDTQERPWFWNGRSWNRPLLDGAPPVASLVAAASDAERRSVLTFGGFTVLGPRRYGDPSGDLWELTADLAWRRRSGSGPQPGPRHHHAVAFDAGRGRLVLYGGMDMAGRWQVDVWEWDRERWHRIATPAGPGERAHHALAYDSRRRRIVLRGGTRSDKVRPLDTWEWDGTTWRQAATGGPGPGNGYRMAYDAERAVTVLFGGDTCVWNGRGWRRMATSAAPGPRAVHALAYDPERACVVLYGGSLGQENAADTWEWNGTQWTERTPA